MGLHSTFKPSGKEPFSSLGGKPFSSLGGKPLSSIGGKPLSSLGGKPITSSSPQSGSHGDLRQEAVDPFDSSLVWKHPLPDAYFVQAASRAFRIGVDKADENVVCLTLIEVGEGGLKTYTKLQLQPSHRQP